MKKDDIDDKSRSLRIKEGIAKAKKTRGKWGRPSVIEIKGDPKLACKASEMRTQGLSWSEIASNLEIGRTTVRRLVCLYQKDGDNSLRIDVDGIASNRKVNCTFGENEEGEKAITENEKNLCQDNRLPSNDTVLNKMPKTFQIFNSLLEKARQKQAK
jgi:hypothetical protein